MKLGTFMYSIPNVCGFTGRTRATVTGHGYGTREGHGEIDSTVGIIRREQERDGNVSWKAVGRDEKGWERRGRELCRVKRRQIRLNIWSWAHPWLDQRVNPLPPCPSGHPSTPIPLLTDRSPFPVTSSGRGSTRRRGGKSVDTTVRNLVSDIRVNVHARGSTTVSFSLFLSLFSVLQLLLYSYFGGPSDVTLD